MCIQYKPNMKQLFGIVLTRIIIILYNTENYEVVMMTTWPTDDDYSMFCLVVLCY